MESLVYNNLVRTIFRQVRSDGMVAQPGERPPHTREVTGSSPVAPTILNSVFMAIVNVIDTLLFYPGVCTKTSVLMYNKITAR